MKLFHWRPRLNRVLALSLVGAALLGQTALVQGQALNLAQGPLFLGVVAPPLNLIVMGRDHKLYYEAYNDASDLNDDGVLDLKYKPNEINYYGYFDSFKCYSYSGGLFTPSSVTANKKCPGSWSGDFLNYLTMSRMDALRKVLYGGYRSTDSTTTTILERSHVPQDAHTWGKEYTSEKVDGFKISDYTPLSQPAFGTRHLFGNLTALKVGGVGKANQTGGTDATNNPPIMRILNDSALRIWEWATTERAVLGLLDPLAAGTSTAPRADSYSHFLSLFDLWGIEELRFDGGPLDQVNCGSNCNPFGVDDRYMTRMRGQFYVANTGMHDLIIDGDDAIALRIGANPVGTADNGDALENTPVAYWYGGHANASANCAATGDMVQLDTALRRQRYERNFTEAGWYYFEFLHQQGTGGDNYRFCLRERSGSHQPQDIEGYRVVSTGNGNGQNMTIETFNNTATRPASQIVEYTIRVEVCKAELLETNCKPYGESPNFVYKPTGILHQFGENNSMYFGLLTGSYKKNMSGGVLRRAISSFAEEVDPQTGIYADNIVGIVRTIDRLRTTGFGNRFEYSYTGDGSGNCGVGKVVNRPPKDGECNMWGNPVAEMMYEALRYFAGKKEPTTAYNIGANDNPDKNLGLPLAAWDNPYDPSTYPERFCARPFITLVSDINPSYDTDQVPGSAFASFSGDLAVDAKGLGDDIWAAEMGGSRDIFIGQSGSLYDGAPTPKSVSSFGDIRGLSPEEPTKLGGYYAASMAYFGNTNQINPKANAENSRVSSFAVALASPLPRIELRVGGKLVTLVPFAKSVGGSGINRSQGQFQPTNQIVDFYVQELRSDYGKFRVNFEDVEQGSDHDMDAIVQYEYQINPNGTVTITLDSQYAAGGIDQHMGYVISGTTKDGIYLEVHDQDGGNPHYFLNTPPGTWANSSDKAKMAAKLPLKTARTFTPSGGEAAGLLRNPLYYVAKWGGFEDSDGDKTPNLKSEWDADGNNIPDNYFLVTNALKLEQQLSAAFNRILALSGSVSAASASASSVRSDTRVFRAFYDSSDWTGDVQATRLDPKTGAELPGMAWEAKNNVPGPELRKIVTSARKGENNYESRQFLWTDLTDDQRAALNTNPADNSDDGRGEERLDYLRGVRTFEAEDGFRERNSVLGDFINSNPQFSRGAASVYRDVFPGSVEGSHAAFRSAQRENYQGHDGLLFVGGNAGKLYAFDIETGAEVFAYVPSNMFPHLAKLTNPAYVHRYFVDGTPALGDAYFSSKWHTVLLGSQRAGGQGIFALDVTGVKTSADFDGDNVLWEFTDQDDPDMGYSFSQPVVARLGPNMGNKWVAIFGNGYNSNESDGRVGSGKPVLFVVDLETGTLLHKVVMNYTGLPNGLSSPSVVDIDGDDVADRVYVGDLQGNLWRVDLTGSQPVVTDANGGTGPFFAAIDKNGNRQPITAKPVVGRGPTTSGVDSLYVYFGTGRYVALDDLSTSRVETLYGLVDYLVTGSEPDEDKWLGNPIALARSADQPQLVEQSIIYEEQAAFGGLARALSNNEVIFESREDDSGVQIGQKRGFYLDLAFEGLGRGERAVSNPFIRNDRVFFTTLIPGDIDLIDDSLCDGGGQTFIMSLDSLRGSGSNNPFFDVNNDKQFDERDFVTVEIDGKPEKFAVVGVGINNIIDNPLILDNPSMPGVESVIGPKGGQLPSTPSIRYGSQPWRELR